MGKTVTERDILQEMLAARPPDREPGWYTRNELAVALNECPNTIQYRINVGMRSGTYECKTARVIDSSGRVVSTKVYRLKPSK